MRPVLLFFLFISSLAMWEAPVAYAAPYCPASQAPSFVLGFAALKQRLGDTMGEPLECEHVHTPSGDTHQQTTTGLAYYRPNTNRAIFTDGWLHWTLSDGVLVSWSGPNSDPAFGEGTVGAVLTPDDVLVLEDALPNGDAATPEVIDLPGRVVGTYNVRSRPRVAPDTLLHKLGHNAPVWVTASVRGADGDLWYRIGDDEYVHSDGVRLPARPAQTLGGRWIDADLTIPAMVTAYQGDNAVYSALAIPGTNDFETPIGTFQIVRRVASETMDSATIGIPRDGPGGYYLEDVLYTQYFTGDGASLHYNWWKGTFGYPGSHGCLGLNRDDAAWFWEWAVLGTRLVIHE